MTRIINIYGLIICLVIATATTHAQKTFSELSGSNKKLYREHIVEGQPDGDATVYVRQGYIMRYNTTYRIPEWVCYHIKPDYLNNPKRERRFSSFKTDNEVPNPVRDPDYTGTGYARGHMAPFFAMGGDRDKNGVYSNAQDESEDPYDDKTVFEANYMSNITPQDQDALNGAGGPWYALETLIRETLVGDHEMELNVYAGAIVSDPDNYPVLKNRKGKTDIAIPDQFYQILIYKEKETKEYTTAAFMFPHVTKKKDLPFDDLLDYMTTVDEIEDITGFDFLNKLPVAKQKKIESKTNREFWESIIDGE